MKSDINLNPENTGNLFDNKHSVLIEHLPYGYALHKIISDKNNIPVDYIIIETNSLFESYTGLKKKDIIGKKITDVIPEIKKDKFDWISFYGNIALKNNKNERIEQFSEALNKWFYISVSSPEKGYFITFLEDITEAKRNAKIKDILLVINKEFNKTDDVEQLAPKIQNELNKIFNTENFYIALYDKKTDTYSFPYHDDKYDKEYAYKGKSYKLEKSLTDYVRKEKKAMLINSETEKELFEKGLIEEYGKYSQVWIGAPLINTKGFSYGVIAVQSYDDVMAYTYDDLSILDYVAKNISKLIEKIQAENYLKESEEKYRMLYETANDAIFLMGNDIFIDCNKKTLEMFACTKEQIIGAAPYVFSPKYQADGRKSKEKALEKINDALKGNPKTFEWIHTKYDGVEFYAEVSLNAFELQNINVIQAIVRDVSERKDFEKELKHKNEELQAAEEELITANDELHWVNDELEKNNQEILVAKEKAENADKLKSAFLANMSHEIRTPLNGILGFSQLLKKDDISVEDKNNFIEIINANGNQLLTIINDIIDISKIEANQIKMFETDANVNVLLDELYTIYSSEIKIKKKEIKLKLTKPVKEKFFVLTDEVRIKQVFSNLLSNAIKFTQKGEIEYGVEFNKEDQLLFFVKDTGIGIARNELDVVFERFRQADSSSTRQFGGTGLGLTISKRLINLLGGDIWVESVKEDLSVGLSADRHGKVGGSQFYFTIPFKHAVNEETIDLVQHDKELLDWSEKTILIVEDDEYSFKFLETTFSETEINIIYANCGEDALKAFKNTPNIDLILMDIQLPDKDGLQVTKEIRKVNKKIPIIAQTAFAMSEDKNNCIIAGCNDYISKPIILDKLLEMVKCYL